MGFWKKWRQIADENEIVAVAQLIQARTELRKHDPGEGMLYRIGADIQFFDKLPEDLRRAMLLSGQLYIDLKIQNLRDQ